MAGSSHANVAINTTPNTGAATSSATNVEETESDCVDISN